MDEIRVFGYCPVCNSEVTSEDDVYVNEKGEYFDSIDCLIEYYNITRVEC